MGRHANTVNCVPREMNFIAKASCAQMNNCDVCSAQCCKKCPGIYECELYVNSTTIHSISRPQTPGSEQFVAGQPQSLWLYSYSHVHDDNYSTMPIKTEGTDEHLFERKCS